MQHAVILANGSFPTADYPLQLLKSATYIICCDGAVNKLEQAGLTPYAIVGDLDSMDPVLKEKYFDRFYHFAEQDTNDLTKTVNWCLAEGFTELTIIGATGERDDHTIGNIFLLLRYASKIKVEMITDYGTFIPLLKSSTINSQKGQQISIFSPYADTVIGTTNLKYPLNDQTLPELWNGTLNEALDSSFRIDFKGKGLIIYLEHKFKEGD